MIRLEKDVYERIKSTLLGDGASEERDEETSEDGDGEESAGRDEETLSEMVGRLVRESSRLRAGGGPSEDE